ncbi:MAG: hypothetical protein NHG36_04375 [Chromatiaceae bacterium]|nr:hypothetical protein [Candidatus Thioaporhodococcus sediminis]
MAASTFTYTANMAEPARACHTGVQSINFAFNSGASKFGTLSDVVLLGKVPNGCVVTGGHIDGTSGAAAIHCMLLAVNSQDLTKSGGTIYGSLTISATQQRFSIYGPIKISLSADATTSEAVLYLNCTTGASGTVSTSINGVIYYVADGRDL